MGQGTDWTFWIIAMLLIIVFFYVPQWASRRRRRQQEKELAVGDRVITIGGFIGTLTRYDPEANIARIRLAEGVEVDILPGAISSKQVPHEGE
ncbi:MAG TPA: preprotein translocase subunit YajC [Anaerolineae bacterium]|nr:preprotein translocase subunit YajC [Anaerolineae bacterium]HQH38101.1 preprotein translocase subunit YajC [Anaerolineae bacterium]